MTERYSEWLALLAQRDWALAQFAALAVVGVMAYEGLRLAPPAIRGRLQSLALAAALLVLLVLSIAALGGGA